MTEGGRGVAGKDGLGWTDAVGVEVMGGDGVEEAEGVGVGVGIGVSVGVVVGVGVGVGV